MIDNSTLKLILKLQQQKAASEKQICWAGSAVKSKHSPKDPRSVPCTHIRGSHRGIASGNCIGSSHWGTASGARSYLPSQLCGNEMGPVRKPLRARKEKSLFPSPRLSLRKAERSSGVVGDFKGAGSWENRVFFFL